jgi:hypothetical protein
MTNLPTTTDRPKPISKKIRAAIDAMVSGDAKTITDAAEKAGLSREHLSRELGKPHIAKVLHEKTARNLNLSAAKAGAAKVDLLSSANDMVRDRVSSWLLELAGNAPHAATGPRGGGPRAGWMIDLSDEPKGHSDPHRPSDRGVGSGSASAPAGGAVRDHHRCHAEPWLISSCRSAPLCRPASLVRSQCGRSSRNRRCRSSACRTEAR